MNTNNIKSFAKRARINLTKAVAQRIQYWGFNENGTPTQEPEKVEGGYMYMGEVSTDTTLIYKWNSLKDRLSSGKDAVKDTIEEVAYTWFNRLVAIKVLEESGFINPVLAFREGSLIPEILQQAKAGQHSITHSGERNSLQEALRENNDEKALAILLKDFCNKNYLINNTFGSIDDFTQILLPNNLLAQDGFLAMLNDKNNISDEDYKQVELIGWLYQFYISDKKDEVFDGFKKNKKARAQDIPAATQIFTPRWIVNYMVQNTLGKTYLAYEQDSELKKEMTYLVETQGQENTTPIISDITELSLIDPACGSGHILVIGLEWLYKAYIEQGYTPKAAIENILEHNLFGLDIDTRAVQLARFAVLIKAAMLLEGRITGQGKTFLQNQPKTPHIYKFPRAYAGFEKQNINLFTEGKYTDELLAVLSNLQQGKNIGTALKITLSPQAHQHLKTQYQKWVEQENTTTHIERVALWKYLKNYIEVALTLTQKYTAVVANPPYMGQKNMNAELKTYLDKHYPMTKSDLFAVFMEVCLNLAVKRGLMGMVNQHSWMFLSSYENYRKYLLQHYMIKDMMHLGTRTFAELSGEVVQNTCFVIENENPTQNSVANYHRLVDYDNTNKKEKHFLLKSNFYPHIPQTNFDKIPGSPIAYWVSDKVIEIFEENKSLVNYSTPRKGNSTSDNKRFLRFWFEVSMKKNAIYYSDIHKVNLDGKRWIPYNKGGGTRKWYGYNENMIDWKDNAKEIREIPTSVITNEQYYMKSGLTWSTISSKGFGIRYFEEGFVFDNGGCCLFDLNENRDYFAGLLNSNVFEYVLGQLNPTLNFQSGEVSKFPVIYNKNPKIDELSRVNYEISKKDWDSRETSWGFVGNPLIAQRKKSVAEAYQSWEQEALQDFRQLHQNEEELNRIFINLYGLQEELSPEVALKDITILQEELVLGENGALSTNAQVVVAQLVSYLVGVLLGRYRLDRGGLHIAHPNATAQETAAYFVENTAEPFEMAIDDDAILPLMGKACAFPDDAVRRIENLIQHIWGEKSHIANINFIESCLGMKLEKYITEKFFDYHKSNYSKRPIYWLFCSNSRKPQQSAFRVLVYMHRMDAYTVNKVMRQYLHPHQEHIRKEYEDLKGREINLSREEKKRLDALPKLIVELKDYNERLKQHADQQIAIDLDEGVTQNYAKFKDILAPIK
ncbi:MAG: BREX-1 system adenine-specific DNA-methyltransferase PglX [Flavobacteriaceae bacterium]|nr:BREX-1 system adenine-specific DNA-methyltransferase PglX [Flavobacteriaceae bacterium]